MSGSGGQKRLGGELVEKGRLGLGRMRGKQGGVQAYLSGIILTVELSMCR